MSERDPALERAWREHSNEMPPPALDRAILAAAHRAVGSRPQQAKPAEATSPQRWWMPLAAAAAIGTVVVGILQTMPADTNLVLSEPPSSGKLAATAPSTPPARPAMTGSNEAARADAAPPAAPAAERRQDAPSTKYEVAPAPSSAPAVADARPAPAVIPAPALPAARRQEPAANAAADATSAKRDAATARVAPPAPPSTPAPMAASQPAQSAVAGAAPPPPPPAPARAEVAVDAARANAASAPEPFPGAAPAATMRSEPAAAPAAKARGEPAAAAPIPSGEADARRDASERGGTATGSSPAMLGRLAQAPAAAPSASARARDEMREGAAKPLAKATASVDAQTKARDPEAWIARIRKLRDEGSTADAIRELREFRDAVPDADRRLPADLREWAAGLRN